MFKFIRKYVWSPIKSKLQDFFSFISYIRASIKKKHACRIRKILIKDTRPMIEFTVLYKPVPYDMPPAEIIQDKALLPRFSQEDAAMIGLLSVIDLHENKNERAKQIEKIRKLFPKLGEHIYD